MKKVFVFTFLIGLIAFICSCPPGPVVRPDQPTEFAQVICADQLQTNIICDVVHVASLPYPDTPEATIGTSEFIMKQSIDFVFKDFGLLLFVSPPIESQCIQDRYKLVVYSLPDKSNKDSRHERSQKLL